MTKNQNKMPKSDNNRQMQLQDSGCFNSEHEYLFYAGFNLSLDSENLIVSRGHVRQLWPVKAQTPCQ